MHNTSHGPARQGNMKNVLRDVCRWKNARLLGSTPINNSRNYIYLLLLLLLSTHFFFIICLMTLLWGRSGGILLWEMLTKRLVTLYVALLRPLSHCYPPVSIYSIKFPRSTSELAF